MSHDRLAMTRAALVERLVEVVEALQRPHPLRVAVDGPDAAGKTTLADELASALRDRGRAVIRAGSTTSIGLAPERYRRGQDSPEGYYGDSFDYAALRHALLDPLGPAGNRAFRRAVHDVRKDGPGSDEAAVASDDAVLLFDRRLPASSRAARPLRSPDLRVRRARRSPAASAGS